MIRAVGGTRKQVRRMVMAEARLLAAIIPARQASRLTVVEALRYE